MFPDEWLPLIIAIGFACFVPIAIKILNILLSPPGRIPRRSKETYECGEKPIGTAKIRYSPQFYTFAIVFVLFDIVSVFIITWSFIFRDSGLDKWLTLGTIGIFSLVVSFGLFFWMKQKAILWG
jgi:NADH:ubiquinone oxidoreductase subunit 3 (subunit A)